MKVLPLRPRWGVGPQVIVVLLIIGLFGALLIEPTRQLLEQRERIAGMASDLETIERSNERLEDRIARLSDPDFLEQRARTVGLVRPGETTYIVMPPSRGHGKKGGQRADRKARAPRVQPPGPIEGFLDFVGIP
ncbi:MAG: FtsB family cell division protein [Actinomycetota bacterium]